MTFRRSLMILLGLGLLLVQSIPFFPPSALHAQVICDPPGPPPRFGCQWSLDICDWICAICDPFGPPPRSSCTWDGSVCNWSCPGYTGIDVTVKTTKAPVHDGTVYVRLSSICTATGAGGSCGGSFAVSNALSVAEKCEAIADTISTACREAGYEVTVNDCEQHATLTASNLGCPATPFALGLSNDPGVFDQTESGALPDGESEKISGSTASCGHRPGAVSNLLLTPQDGGTDILLTWDDAPDADDYVVYSDTTPNGAFSAVAGTASSGIVGLSLGTLPGNQYYLVAGRNQGCGIGPRH
jgi:hypothetical protein